MTETRYLKHRISVDDPPSVDMFYYWRSREVLYSEDYMGTLFKTMCPEHRPLCLILELETVIEYVHSILNYLDRNRTLGETKHQIVIVQGYAMVLSMYSLEELIQAEEKATILYEYAIKLAKALYDRWLLNIYYDSDLRGYMGFTGDPYERGDRNIRLTEVNLYISQIDTGPEGDSSGERRAIRALFSFEQSIRDVGDTYVVMYGNDRDEKADFGPAENAEMDRLNEVSKLYRDIWDKHTGEPIV